MEKTTNYQLNKPEVTDPLRLADFNENADVIDGLLAELASGTPYVVGSYASTNDSEKDVTVELGFQPSMVIISKPGETNAEYGATCTKDDPVVAYSKTIAAVTETGFTVGLAMSNSRIAAPYTNYGGTYVYIAFR